MATLNNITTETARMQYRPEIDGLRAIAVIAVIIFHLDETLLPNGYLGVDVFFVISGYLITRIIYPQILEKKFSYKTFIKRRFFRLFPALLTVAMSTFAFGIYTGILSTDNTISILLSIISVQNINLFINTNGYWGIDANRDIFLHCWSLSIEEQFYIFFPGILYLLVKFTSGMKQLTWALFIIIIASLGSQFLTLHLNHSASFFLPHNRAWELLAGSLLGILHSNPTRPNANKHILNHTGLLLILLPILLNSLSYYLNNWINSIVIFGTVLLLNEQRSKYSYARILSSTILKYIGKLSYSLYLWHWPVIFYMKQFGYLNFNILSIVVAITLIIILSIITYHFIEQKLRKPSPLKFKILISLATISIASLLFFPTLGKQNDQLLQYGDLHHPKSKTKGRKFEANRIINETIAGITQINNIDDQIDIICIGSSHARVLCPPISNYAKLHNLNFISMSVSGVEITESNKNTQINTWRINHIKKLKPEITIISGKWQYFYNQTTFINTLKRNIQIIAENSKFVIFVGQVPHIRIPKQFGRDVRTYLKTRLPNVLEAKPEVKSTNEKIFQLVTDLNLSNIFIVDPYSSLINEKGHIRTSYNNLYIYCDDHHLNEIGANYLFNKQLKLILDNTFLTK